MGQCCAIVPKMSMKNWSVRVNAPAAGVGEGEGGSRRVLFQYAGAVVGTAGRIHSGVGTICSCPPTKRGAAGDEVTIIREIRLLGRSHPA